MPIGCIHGFAQIQAPTVQTSQGLDSNCRAQAAASIFKMKLKSREGVQELRKLSAKLDRFLEQERRTLVKHLLPRTKMKRQPHNSITWSGRIARNLTGRSLLHLMFSAFSALLIFCPR